MFSGMKLQWTSRALGVDTNGCATESLRVGGQTLVVHYDDVPDSDITTVRGIPCTTPLRTVIDIAVDLDPSQLHDLVGDCLERHLFTVDEAMARIAQPDMSSRPGARVLRAELED